MKEKLFVLAGDTEVGKTTLLESLVSKKFVDKVSFNTAKGTRRKLCDGVIMIDSPGFNDTESWRQFIAHNGSDMVNGVIFVHRGLNTRLSMTEKIALRFLSNCDGVSEKTLLFVITQLDITPRKDFWLDTTDFEHGIREECGFVPKIICINIKSEKPYDEIFNILKHFQEEQFQLIKMKNGKSWSVTNSDTFMKEMHSATRIKASGGGLNLEIENYTASKGCFYDLDGQSLNKDNVEKLLGVHPNWIGWNKASYDLVTLHFTEFSITTTADHQFWTKRGWVAAVEIQVWDEFPHATGQGVQKLVEPFKTTTPYGIARVAHYPGTLTVRGVKTRPSYKNWSDCFMRILEYLCCFGWLYNILKRCTQRTYEDATN